MIGEITIFFDDNLQIEIIDVFHINRAKQKLFTPKRPFHILSKRISGYADMIFKDESLRVTENDILYIPANTEYTRLNYENEELIAIHFNILNKSFTKPSAIKVDSDLCNKTFMEMSKAWNERNFGFRYHCTAALYEYLCTVIMEGYRSKEYYKIEKSIKYIENNLTQNLQIGNLAKMCNFSETQYRKLFKKEFGVSPVKYINKLRVSTAMGKIVSGYYSMAEISDLCGFSDQKHFHSVFKSETGKSPTQYKNEK